MLLNNVINVISLFSFFCLASRSIFIRSVANARSASSQFSMSSSCSSSLQSEKVVTLVATFFSSRTHAVEAVKVCGKVGS